MLLRKEWRETKHPAAGIQFYYPEHKGCKIIDATEETLLEQLRREAGSGCGLAKFYWFRAAVRQGWLLCDLAEQLAAMGNAATVILGLEMRYAVDKQLLPRALDQIPPLLLHASNQGWPMASALIANYHYYHSQRNHYALARPFVALVRHSRCWQADALLHKLLPP